MTIQLNKSFSRRIGKSLSTTQKHAIENLLPTYLLDPASLPNQNFIAEIGIGMGEHFINQARSNPDIIHIGFEPYLNGIANALLLAQKDGITNIRLWPDDMDLMFNKLTDSCLDALYILFPDPWPKNNQKKRRIICDSRLQTFATKMSKDSILYFASDIEDYVNFVEKSLNHSQFFSIIDNIANTPHTGYIQTKYHSKAIAEGRRARFLSARKS
jgi:release factor glutamine methyltransferase